MHVYWSHFPDHQHQDWNKAAFFQYSVAKQLIQWIFYVMVTAVRNPVQNFFIKTAICIYSGQKY